MPPPTKGKGGPSKGPNKGSSKGPSKGGKPSSRKPSSGPSSGGIRKKPTGKPGVKPKIVQQKTKSALINKKKPRVYTEKELGIPELNGIRPAGVAKPPNAKKGKHFVDDGDGMNAILAIVMAEKEGNIESKMMRSRQLEEIREARRAEMEERANHKKAGFEERKKGIRDEERKKGTTVKDAVKASAKTEADKKAVMKHGKAKSKKRVSFG
jgi:60S ribosomal subunit assembly/export protein LOC1